MVQGPPPVVDHVKRTTIQEVATKSPFNVFNIVAIVAILVIGYFLYRKFNEKFSKGAIRMPVMPRPPAKEAAPVVVEAAGEPEVPETKAD